MRMMASSSSLLLQFLVPLLLPLLLISPSYAQSHRNISLGSLLTPLGRNTSWLSPSGEFAFGFHPLENSNLFLLAIWFEKTAEKAVVWCANRDKPMQYGSTAELTTDGQLLLKNHSGQEVWNAAINNASYAAMLDTGNFVLVGADDSVNWQSFDTPTDTILPSQVLDPGTELQARLTATDYSSGRFKLSFQDGGNLVLYTAAVPSGNQSDTYWTSDVTVRNGSKLVFNESGSIYFTQKNGTIFNSTSATMEQMKDFYQRATLDFDGVFRQYVHPRNGTRKGSWNESWTPVYIQPPDICQAITAKTGGGACGYNSHCIFEGLYADCECPPSYSFFDPSRKYKGCKPDFAAQSCDADEKEIEALYEFQPMIGWDWPLSEYEQLYPIEEDQCRKECLSDCFCVAATYNDWNCTKMNAPLSNGKTGSSPKTKSLIKVPRSNTTQFPPPIPIGERKDKKSWTRTGWLLLGTSALINILLVAALLLFAFHCYKKRIHSLQPNSSGTGMGLRSLTYRELQEATNNFSEQLDYGGPGAAYKGYMLDDSSTRVAVKRIENLLPDAEGEFINIVKAIGQVSHKNLVRLLGFCDEGTERFLVYEFLSTGPLRSFLFGNVRLKWNQRIQVALGIARGLLYLHEECGSQIIHCAIQPRNILLDDNFVAKISNFEFGKLLRADQTRADIAVRGTAGYIAPEWFKNMGITAKVDVYSFGVMLLEIVCCRKNLEPAVENDEAAILTNWVNSCYRNRRLDMVVGGDEEAIFDLRRVERFVTVALWCVQEEPSLRPTMWKVAQMLDGAATVPVPPDPSSYISSIQ